MAGTGGGTALVLGATGKVGRMLCARALADAWDGVRVLPVGRRPVSGGVIWAPGDDRGALPHADVVVALWGVTGGDPEALAMNAALAAHAQAIGARIGARRVLHMSSAAVYAGRPVPWPETGPPAPQGAYGKAKLDMERAVDRLCADGTGPEAVCLRIGNVAGADMLFGNMARGGTITLDRFPDATGPVRSYIAPHDLARVLAALCRADSVPHRAINVAAPGPVAMDAIVRAAGRVPGWRTAPPAAVASLTVDTARLAAFCTLAPETADPAHLVRSARAAGAAA